MVLNKEDGKEVVACERRVWAGGDDFFTGETQTLMNELRGIVQCSQCKGSCNFLPNSTRENMQLRSPIWLKAQNKGTPYFCSTIIHKL